MADPIAPQNFNTVPAHRYTTAGPSSSDTLASGLGFATRLTAAAAGASPYGSLLGGGLNLFGGAGGGSNIGGVGGTTDFAALINKQLEVQMMSQQFTAQSNILRVEHDTRMSAVRNIRA